MQTKYRWGILSTANIGRIAMIPALQASKQAEVVAVASRNLESAEKFSADLDIEKAYGSYQDLLDDPNIDIIYIPLPNHLHKKWTIRAAESGKHILCEKPIALNPDECHEMINAARDNGVKLMESFMYRHHPRILSAVDLVRSGKIGDLKVIETGFTFKLKNLQDIRYQPEMGGGALMDVGCYCVNIIRLMAGREPVSMQAKATWTKTGVDEQLIGILDFEDGLTAHFDCGFNMTSRQRCLIAGTEGYLEIPNCFLPGNKKSSITEVRGPGNIKTHSFKGVDQYRLIADDFMHSITSNKPLYDIDDANANMRVIEALINSAKNGGIPVEV